MPRCTWKCSREPLETALLLKCWLRLDQAHPKIIKWVPLQQIINCFPTRMSKLVPCHKTNFLAKVSQLAENHISTFIPSSPSNEWGPTSSLPAPQGWRNHTMNTFNQVTEMCRLGQHWPFPVLQLLGIIYIELTETQMGEVVTQLLVPKTCREMLFHMVHHNPIVGQLGVDSDTCWWCVLFK